MFRTVAFLALFPVFACGNAETAQQADANAKGVKGLEDDQADFDSRLLALEGAVAQNTTDVAEAGTQARAAVEQSVQNADAIADLTVRVDGHDLAVSEAAGAVAGLDAQLFDPTYGEIPRLDSAIADNASTLLTQQAAIDAAASAVAANTLAVADLGATVAILEPTVQQNTVQIGVNTSEIAANRVDIDANTADVAANSNAIGVHDVTIGSLQASISGFDAQIDTNTNAIAQNTAAVASNSGAIAQNSVDIAQNAADIAAIDLTGIEADVAANGSAIADNAADISVIETNTVAPVSDLLTYLSVDLATDTVSISGADLFVDGKVTAQNVTFRQCAGGQYTCTPLDCLALCQSNGERMATTDEALAWASRGQNKCSWQWMLDRNDPSVPVRAFPMYFNRTAPGCGPTNTGDIPRFGGGPVAGTGWTDPATWNCACAAL